MSKIKIVRKEFKNLTFREKMVLYGLTLKVSYMKGCLNYIFKDCSEREIKNNYILLLAKEDELICGWGLIGFGEGLRKKKKEAEIGLYVRKEKRRMGIGEKILKRAMYLVNRRNKNTVVYMHDRASRRFYRKLGFIKEKGRCYSARLPERGK